MTNNESERKIDSSIDSGIVDFLNGEDPQPEVGTVELIPVDEVDELDMPTPNEDSQLNLGLLLPEPDPQLELGLFSAKREPKLIPVFTLKSPEELPTIMETAEEKPKKSTRGWVVRALKPAVIALTRVRL